MWDLPRSGIEPASPGVAGIFFTPESPGKPKSQIVITYEAGERVELERAMCELLVYGLSSIS